MKRLVSMGLVVTGMAIALTSLTAPAAMAFSPLTPDLAQQFNPPGGGYPDRTRGGGTQMGAMDEVFPASISFQPPGEGYPSRTRGGGTH